MSFWEILDTLLLKPLELFFEIIYIMTNKMIDNPGMSIIVLSLTINFLILPLYRRADAMQEEEREMEKKLQRGVSHIKKTFHGDERMMMLQTYYRQNGYKPTYVLRGATSLFLEIPFFITAYRFLSNLQLLNGVAFGPIADLGKPDGLLMIAGVSVNILPIIMTVVNLISCVIFTKECTLRSKIQLYAMAVFFLIFLYSCSSGLVFYWTLNNVFSLLKTILYKLKNPGKILGMIFFAAGLLMLVWGLFFYGSPTLKRKILFSGVGILLQMPFLYSCIKGRIHFHYKSDSKNADKKVFFSSGIFFALLTGLLIPSAVIQASPQEFVDIELFYHPLWFLVSSFCLALGTFVIWMGVFYWLAKPSVRPYFDKAVWIFAGTALINYMFFGKNLGNLSPWLTYDSGMTFTGREQLWNLAVLLIPAIILYVIYRYWKRKTPGILMSISVAFGVMSFLNIYQIQTSIENIKGQIATDQEMDSNIPRFTLSKTGKNVIVLMLDRAKGEYIPYLFNEKPGLKEKFGGFTYYSNVISFGGHTNFGAPALFGGYEYTPVEMNKRKDETLVSKHNEALKIMPVLFDQNGYSVTVSDPTYANYQWHPDFSIYNEYPDIKTLVTSGKFVDEYSKEKWIHDNKRNFFCYGILQTIPLGIRNMIYGYGDYNQGDIEGDYSEQTMTGKYTSSGISASFMEAYSVLDHLPGITDITDSEQNTFLLMTNNTTHDVMMLQEPDYVPEYHIDNTKFEFYNQDRFVLDSNRLKMESEIQLAHYQSNMAAMLQLGEWFDYMRTNGVYDNTRIVLVSDHGYPLGHLEALLYEDGKDISEFFPLLMVKDFDNKEFSVCDEFMTNGDVPYIAMEGLLDSLKNPFTGKIIDSREKTTHVQYIIDSLDFSINKNNGNTFLPAKWYSVHDNIWDKDNWEMVTEEAVLPKIDKNK